VFAGNGEAFDRQRLIWRVLFVRSSP